MNIVMNIQPWFLFRLLYFSHIKKYYFECYFFVTQNRKDMNLSKLNNVSTFLANGSDNSVHMLLMLFTILFSQFIYKFTKILQ